MMNRIFSSIRTFDNLSNNAKTCHDCGQPATKDALFDVGNGIAVVERYCDQCAKIVENNNRSQM
jgi:hypothetical protein